MELVNVRVAAIGRAEPVSFRTYPASDGKIPNPESRPVYFDQPVGWVDTRVYRRSDLQAGQTVLGPAIVDQADATVLVSPGWTAHVDPHLSIVLTRT